LAIERYHRMIMKRPLSTLVQTLVPRSLSAVGLLIGLLTTTFAVPTFATDTIIEYTFVDNSAGVAGFSTPICTGTLYDDVTLNEVAAGSLFDFAQLGLTASIPVGSTIYNSGYGSPVVGASVGAYGQYDWILGVSGPAGSPQSFTSWSEDGYGDLFDKDNGYGKWVEVSSSAPDNGSTWAMVLISLAALGLAARVVKKSELAAY
jgi:hypothetical protein